MTSSRVAVFLDRDGTLNRDSPEYVKSLSEFTLYPDVVPCLGALHRAGFALVVITNQSAIARGLTTRTEVDRMHEHLRLELDRAAIPLLDVRLCPHAPADACACRKPHPGLILAACTAHGLDVAASFMVGDKETDVEAGVAAGCRTILLDREARDARKTKAHATARDLLEVAAVIERYARGR